MRHKEYRHCLRRLLAINEHKQGRGMKRVGATTYELAKWTGYSQPTCHRFMDEARIRGHVDFMQEEVELFGKKSVRTHNIVTHAGEHFLEITSINHLMSKDTR